MKTLQTHIEKYHKPEDFECSKRENNPSVERILKNHSIEEQEVKVTLNELSDNIVKESNNMDVDFEDECTNMDVDEDVEGHKDDKQGAKREEEIERIERSRMRDKQILEKEKKNEDKERLLEEKKKEIEMKKFEEERRKKEKEKSDKKKKKAYNSKQKEKKRNYPNNVKELPDNVKHLVGDGDLQLMVPPDGACAANAGACHIFHDAKYGPQFRMVMNNHMADRWHFYKNKVNFPYERQVGVSGKFVRFEVSEEENFANFLKQKNQPFFGQTVRIYS